MPHDWIVMGRLNAPNLLHINVKIGSKCGKTAKASEMMNTPFSRSVRHLSWFYENAVSHVGLLSFLLIVHSSTRCMPA